MKEQGRSAHRIKSRPPGLWRWHLWAGLAGLAVLLVAAVSGTLLVYQKELVASVVTPAAELPVDYAPETIARQLETIASRRGTDSILRLKAPSSVEPYWSVRHEQGLELLALDNLEPYQNRLWFLRSMEFIRELHVELCTSVWGEALLLISGILALFLCISGLVLWWPGRRAFHWRWVFPRGIRPSQWLQYHRHSGALASPLLILIIFTGSLMLWQKLVQPILPPPNSVTIAGTSESQQVTGVAENYRRIQAMVPDGWPTVISLWSEQGAPMMKVRFRLPGEWHLNGRTSVQFNGRTGELVVSERSDQMSAERRLLNQLYPLHSGFGMNGVYRLLTLFAGVVLTWLTVTGGLHYLKRWKHRRRRQAG